MDTIGFLTSPEMTPILTASLWPEGINCFTWGVIYVVAYFINVFIAARFLLPAGLPDSKKPARMKGAFLLSIVLSWPIVYLITLMVSEMALSDNTMGLLGSMIAWLFFVGIDSIANWKVFEAYFPIRQTLGGSEAYANLNRHMWGHLLAILGAIITALGVFIWHVVR